MELIESHAKLQNGERMRSHVTHPIRTELPSERSHVGPKCRDWPVFLNSFGEADWSVRDPLAAVGSSCQCSVCVWYGEQRRNWLDPAAN